MSWSQVKARGVEEGEPSQSWSSGTPSCRNGKNDPDLSLPPSSHLLLLLPTDLNQPETRGGSQGEAISRGQLFKAQRE